MPRKNGTPSHPQMSPDDRSFAEKAKYEKITLDQPPAGDLVPRARK